MSRRDGLGTLPFADYADPDPDALPFDQARADDRQVFGPDRPAAARHAIGELESATLAAESDPWNYYGTHERIRRAAAVRAMYAEYADARATT